MPRPRPLIAAKRVGGPRPPLSPPPTPHPRAPPLSPNPLPTAEVPTPSRVYVHNLPWSLTNEELAAHMSSVGTVRYASIMTTTDGRSKGCA